MLLMIELFMGGYKGVGNDSAQEFHRIPETATKVEQDAGLGLGLGSRSSPELVRSTNTSGCKVILLSLRHRTCPPGPQAPGTPISLWHY